MIIVYTTSYNNLQLVTRCSLCPLIQVSINVTIISPKNRAIEQFIRKVQPIYQGYCLLSVDIVYQ